MRTVSLVRLLSSCLDANRKGCDIIQKFYNGISSTTVDGGKLKVEGDARSVVTQADVDAQAMIVGGLRGLWGDDLRIVGEEDEAVAQPIVDSNNILKTDLLDGGNSFLDEEIPINELALFVDPLDGTREFVEGRVGNVGCLIGVCRNSRPIAGAVGVPFPGGSTESEAVVHYAIAEQESSASWSASAVEDSVVDKESSQLTETTTAKSVTIFTGDSKDPILISATRCATTLAHNPRHVILGGTAAKLIRVATESNAIAVLHFKTELWDTASLQALLEAKGGKITDLFGSPLVHDPDRPFGNIFGVVASSGQPEVDKLHDELCSRMRADVSAIEKIFKKWMVGPIPEAPQAVDISRDLDGIPLSVSFIQQQLASSGQTQGAELQSYSVPESGAWRGMMSSGGRLLLNWETKNADANGLPSSVFYKRIVMADLAHARSKLTAAPHKLVRDVKSYQVETSFLTSRACRDGLVNEAGVRVNKIYGADVRPAPEGASAKEQLESKFSALFEDFNAADGWEQQWLLDEEATKATLNELAKMHAYFWNGSQFWEKEAGDWATELEEVVWKNGGYMQAELQGYDQLDKVAKGWEKRYPTFKDALADVDMLKGESLMELGTRLQAIARSVGADAHPFFDGSDVASNFQKHRTFIHGDPKQANVFLKRDANDKSLHVGLIDFQWSGFGLAATDIAHHICAAVHPSCLSYDGQKENELLDYYYNCLSNYLVKHGVAKSLQDVEGVVYPRAILQEQYETALLDTARMVIAYAWRRWKAETQPTPESFNRNPYNKSLESALWLVTRCHILLKQRLED